jgi:hypothetical protein
MKRLVLLLAISATIISCSSNQKSSGSDSTKKDTSAKSADSKPAVDSSKVWKYVTDTDKMTSKTRNFAVIDATNKLEFGAPYDGGSTGQITLRNQNNTNEVILTIDKGQFICDITDGCPINVRFDSDPAIKFKGSEPSDGSSTTLFIENGSKFIKQAKKAKKVLIETEFYESGLKTMEFSIDGLKWDH